MNANFQLNVVHMLHEEMQVSHKKPAFLHEFFFDLI